MPGRRSDPEPRFTSVPDGQGRVLDNRTESVISPNQVGQIVQSYLEGGGNPERIAAILRRHVR